MEKLKLSCCEKVKEFLAAPIMTFWYWTISYVFFLLIFLYTALIETKPEPTWQEYFLVSYAVTYGLEMFRQFLISEERTCFQKTVTFCQDLWKVSRLLAIIALVIAFVMRHWRNLIDAAHVIYAVDCGFWFLRLLEVIEVNSLLGQYMSVMAKMLFDTVYVVSIMLITLVTFGVMRTSILNPYHKEWDWWLLREVYYRPYFMWYGEVYHGDIDNCAEPNQGECLPGNWLAATAHAVYMMLTNIILLNLLIAMFNHIYVEASAISTQVWKFKRYHHVMEYEQQPTLPPPLCILYHFYALFQFFVRLICGKCCRMPPADYNLKLILKNADVEKLLDFEEECMEDFTAHKEKVNYFSQNVRLRRITDRQEFMSMKLDELATGHDAAFTTLTESNDKLKELNRIFRSGGGSADDTTPPLMATPGSKASAVSRSTPGRMSAGQSFLMTDYESERTAVDAAEGYRNSEYTTFLDGIDIGGCAKNVEEFEILDTDVED